MGAITVTTTEEDKKPCVSKWSKPSIDESCEFVRCVRERGPATYSIKIESLASLKTAIAKNDKQKDYVELNSFDSGSYKWALCVYPEGNEKDDGKDHLSLYLRLISSLKGDEVIVVMFNFFIYDQLRDTYLMIQGLKEKRFHAAKTEWGLSKVISLNDLNDASNGFLKDDSCVFGVEVFYTNVKTQVAVAPSTTQLYDYSFKWGIPSFSKLKLPSECSPDFTFKNCSWKLLIFPKGIAEWSSESDLALYLCLGSGHY